MPLEFIKNGLAEFGLVGVVIFALFSLIFVLLRSHKEERKEFRQEFAQMHNRDNEVMERLRVALIDLTVEIKSQKTQNRRRK